MLEFPDYRAIPNFGLHWANVTDINGTLISFQAAEIAQIK